MCLCCARVVSAHGCHTTPVLHLFSQDDARYFLVTNTEGQLVAFTHFRCACLQADAGVFAWGDVAAAAAPNRLLRHAQ
jgi:hypothetical protein